MSKVNGRHVSRMKQERRERDIKEIMDWRLAIGSVYGRKVTCFRRKFRNNGSGSPCDDHYTLQLTRICSLGAAACSHCVRLSSYFRHSLLSNQREITHIIGKFNINIEKHQNQHIETHYDKRNNRKSPKPPQTCINLSIQTRRQVQHNHRNTIRSRTTYKHTKTKTNRPHKDKIRNTPKQNKHTEKQTNITIVKHIYKFFNIYPNQFN